MDQAGPLAVDVSRDRLQALQGLAMAVAATQGEGQLPELTALLARALRARLVVAAVFADESRAQLRTLAAVVDGQPASGYDYARDGAPCFCNAADAFRYVRADAGPDFAACRGAPAGLDSYAAYPLRDRAGQMLGLLLAADPAPVAGGDAVQAESLMAVVAARLVAEVERNRTEESLQAIAVAVSRSRSDAVFDELVQLMATVLGVEVAFVARVQRGDPDALTMLAMYYDGQLLHDIRYPMRGTPCETVLGQRFRIYPERLQGLFPEDHDARAQCTESYAGHPLTGADGTPLGVVSVASRRPLVRVDRIEALLKIFAVRAGAEIERLSAREALEHSERNYRAIFDAAEDAILVLDWNSGDIQDVNRKACESYGYSHDELVRLTCGDLVSEDAGYSRERMMPFFMQARLGCCPPFEWHRRSKDGSLHWDEVNLKPAVIGGQRHILAFTREITERKQALEQLQLREEQYRTIFESSSDALFLWDAQLRLVDINPAALAMYRYRREQVIGHGYSDEMPQDYVSSRRELLSSAIAGESRHIETRALRADGTWFDADVRAMPFRHRGQPHALAVIRDISERRERERELQRSEARLRATVEAAFDCVITMDSDGHVMEFNAAAERVFGYTRAEAVGRKLSGLIVPQRLRDAHDRGLAHFRGHSGPMVGRLVETTAQRADGTEFPVELAISVADVPDGSIYVGHLRDISARRAAEAERAALEAQLRQAQKMEAIGQLTGGIAHDFNNILTSVMGYVVMGRERAEDLGDAPLVRQLGQAHLAAQRARDLISQMLAFARRQKGDPRPLALTPLVRQTLRLLRSILPSTILLDAQWLDADGEGEAAWVVADPVQLEQIVFNLCINARDAMQGTGRITVRLTRREGEPRWHCASCRLPVGAGPWVVLRVSDTGEGIPRENLDRIFDPFFSTKAPGQGSGMGLAMVHGIVHDHAGHVLVETAPGEGASFAVLLPAARAGDAPAHAGAARTVATAALHGRILLVEDEPMVGDYMVDLLAGWGLQAVLERDPLAAARRLEDAAEAFDLLLADQTMPGLTGLELARHAAGLRPGLPVLLYTGNASAITDSELVRCGVRALLRKPLEPEALRAQLRAWLPALDQARSVGVAE
jgi:PAS domain S-box-containing protein